MRLSGLLVALVAALAAGLWGQAAGPDIDASIRALERQWMVGQARNDDRALNLLFDDALLYVEYGRLVSKGEYLTRIKTQVPNLDQITMEGMAVRIFGDTAVVVGSYREKPAPGGNAKIRRWKFVDTWVYKKNGWVLVAAGATAVRND
jgi:Domain of unknown function (DUF4440)